MNLTLIISVNCKACERVEKHLRDIQKRIPRISLSIVNINKLGDQKITITPALLIEDELFAYGDIDEDKLISKIIESVEHI